MLIFLPRFYNFLFYLKKGETRVNKFIYNFTVTMTTTRKRYRSKGRTRNRRKKGSKRNRISKYVGRGAGSRYESSNVKRRRTSNVSGRGIVSALKNLGKFAARNAPTILKGARYLASKSGNKTLKSIANSELLDMGADRLSAKFKGRGAMKRSSVKQQAKNVVRKLIALYGEEGTRKILRKYMSTRGRGVVGKVLGNILATVLPF